jgi:hypothetical protein
MEVRNVRRPSYSDLVATLALFIALGGTSYAVANLPRNSVGTAQLKAHAVTRAKLAAGLPITGKRGPAGVRGPAGPAGPAGLSIAGPSGLLGVEIITGGTTATCPAGKQVIGGGARVEGVSAGMLTVSAPTPDGSGWIASVTSPSVVASYAICALRPMIP